jgi:large subunit ribosomal protein L9
VEVDRRLITLAEPIKQLGDFTVTVRLESEVEARLKVNVTAAGE